MPRETYEFKEAPEYTSATYYGAPYGPFACVNMDEWSGRTFAEFAAGMAGRGFKYRKEEYEMSGRKFIEHFWEK